MASYAPSIVKPMRKKTLARGGFVRQNVRPPCLTKVRSPCLQGVPLRAVAAAGKARGVGRRKTAGMASVTNEFRALSAVLLITVCI